MIDEHLLRNAVALDEYRNFARAANALHISQPTLSRRIQMLESAVGERLFDRQSRTIIPTQAGEIVLRYARRIHASSQAMQEEISRHQGIVEGSLRIGSVSYVGSGLLAPTISLFCKRYPNIYIDTIVDVWSNLPDRMLRENFDFVLAETSELETTRDFELIQLNSHPGFLYCRVGHPLQEKANITTQDVAQFSLISPGIPARLANLFDNLFFPDVKTGCSSKKWGRITVSDQAMIKALVLNGDGIAVGTFATLAPEIKAGIFSALPLRISELKSQYGIVTRKGVSSSPTARAFMALLVESDQESSVLETAFIDSLGPPISTQGIQPSL
ncbi:MAG: hypothetical protein DRR06_03965 [Gammaproteobacteria bacterium]|nr:MAG: hypothetical protein DRR06_03965 [Gammaproteobacteria bacterium]RLA50687.1 MAG: hypothetical protein DRR42_12410 [Gammaproteobacteria bacterium]